MVPILLQLLCRRFYVRKRKLTIEFETSRWAIFFVETLGSRHSRQSRNNIST